MNQLFGDLCAILRVGLWKKPGTTNLAVERPRPSPVPVLKAAISPVWTFTSFILVI
jgi:hypothetical protein